MVDAVAEQTLPERTGRTVQLVPADGSKPTVVGGDTVSPSTARISPDGRWLAFASYRTAQPQVYVSPIPATGDQWPVSAAGGEHPQWRSDGRELFFLAPDGSIVSATIAPGPKFDVAAPRVLFETGLTGDPASQRFVATRTATDSCSTCSGRVIARRRRRLCRWC